MSHLAFVDTETLGLDIDQHPIWEVGLIIRDGPKAITEDREYCWTLPTYWDDLSVASPDALRINGFYSRGEVITADADPQTLAQAHSEWDNFAYEFASLTAGKHLVAAVPSFDAPRLEKVLRTYGYAPAWHYHLIDVEALVAGRKRIHPPWNSNELYLSVGIDSAFYDTHTALGDARMARDVYDAVYHRKG